MVKKDYRKLLNKKDPLDRLILEKGEKGDLDVGTVGLRGPVKDEKKKK